MSTPMFDLPEHFPMPVNADGAGPVDEWGEEYDHTECWCGDTTCEKWRDL